MDHPRVCGEKSYLEACREKQAGSPPRVRGKAARAALLCLDTRITPACAGKSMWERAAGLDYEDHPRVCGEKLILLETTAAQKGSPPRVRGKVQPNTNNIQGSRITPAYAGKSTRLSLFAIFSGDHPRVCGEKNADLLRSRILRGSPPRVRGKVVVQQGNPSTSGITPACAGKSCCPALF